MITNLELELISNYIYDFKTIKNLFEINNTLKHSHHTHVIQIPCNYILTNE